MNPPPISCPTCSVKFRGLLSNVPIHSMPEFAPILCDKCLEISLLVKGEYARKMTPEETENIQHSKAWKSLEEAREALRMQEAREVIRREEAREAIRVSNAQNKK